MGEEVTREHRGDGARKAARRKFRHKLLNERITELGYKLSLSPKAIRFHARVILDIIQSQGTDKPDAHGRGLVGA
jgi:hypothetical protein